MSTSVSNIKTLQAWAWKGRATIPAVTGINKVKPEHEESGIGFAIGDVIGNYRITKFLCRGERSTLFVGEGIQQGPVVIKVYEPGESRNRPALRKLADVLKRRGCSTLMPLLSFGDIDDNIHYEVMPVYQQGTLEGERFTEEELKKYILPQLNDALTFLGENHIVHNDIKPSNIFWKNRSRKEIVLGDYDCVSLEKNEAVGGTPFYMAPERIYSDGTVHTNSSDYCSLGLTLITLLTGQILLEDHQMPSSEETADIRHYLHRRWQRTVACPANTDLSPQTRNLLNCLVQPKPEDRYDGKFISSWIANDGIGIKRYQEERKRHIIQGLPFRQKLIMDIAELISELGRDWDFGVYLLKHHQLDSFVRQFNGEYYKYCVEYSSTDDGSAGLFMLMQKIAPAVDFYWMGTHYASLEDFVNQTEEEGKYGQRDPFSRFCRAGLLSFYEAHNGADSRQMQRAQEIEKLAGRNPAEAIRKLQISLRQKPDFIWNGETFRSLEDLMHYLEQMPDRLDEEISMLYGSSAFKVWLDFTNRGSFLSKIEKKLMESGI